MFCRRCQYCQPCPQGVKITNLMTMDSFIKRMPPARVLDGWIKDAAASVSQCTKCGQCEAKCPYKLPIMERIAAGAEAYRIFEQAHRPGCR